MQKIALSQIKMIEAKVQSSDEYISLSQGALKVGGVPIEIKKYLQQVLQTDKTDYYQSAWGIMSLREAIAADLSKKHAAVLSSKNILVTHGCVGAISTLLFTLLQPGDEVILPEPTYPAYKQSVALAHGTSVFVSCPETIDLEALESARTAKTKVLLFSNPCNPTGVVISQQILEQLITWCKQHRIYLIVDESYDDYVFEGNFTSATSYVQKGSYVIRTGSYSKSLSMSGWRVGFMVVPESLSHVMGVTQDAMLNCPNVIAQYAVLYALQHPKFAKQFCSLVKQRRDDAIVLLQPLIDEGLFSFHIPRAGFYLFLRQGEVLHTNDPDSFALCMSLLDNARVGLIPGNAFGPSGAPYIRLCYARTRPVLHEGIMRIRKFFDV